MTRGIEMKACMYDMQELLKITSLIYLNNLFRLNDLFCWKIV